MTERERANRKRYAARLARIDREVEAFKRTAKIVPTRHRSECYEGAEYADLKKKGLTLRVEKIKPDFREKDLWDRDIPQRPCHRWFYTRPGAGARLHFTPEAKLQKRRAKWPG